MRKIKKIPLIWADPYAPNLQKLRLATAGNTFAMPPAATFALTGQWPKKTKRLDYLTKPGESKKNNCKNRKLAKIRQKNLRKKLNASMKRLTRGMSFVADALNRIGNVMASSSADVKHFGEIGDAMSILPEPPHQPIIDPNRAKYFLP